MDALQEYIHLSASAVKINFPSVRISQDELIKMVENVPFYRVHEKLCRFMMERLQWQQFEQKQMLHLKAAAINAQKQHAKMKDGGGISKWLKRTFWGGGTLVGTEGSRIVASQTTGSGGVAVNLIPSLSQKKSTGKSRRYSSASPPPLKAAALMKPNQKPPSLPTNDPRYFGQIASFQSELAKEVWNNGKKREE